MRAGFLPIWANDFDEQATRTYNANIPGNHAVFGPIETARDQLPAADQVDVVIGGPPCQGFSVAGRMDPLDPRSKHVSTFIDVVEALEPQAFVMENVRSLATNPRWSGIVDALRFRAEDLGFQTDVFVLNAADYRVPQSRYRMFLVGIRGAAPRVPKPMSSGSPITVRQALATLPSVGKPGNEQRCTAIITPAKRPVLRKSPYAGLLLNGKGRILNLDAPSLTLPATMGGNRTPVVDEAQWRGDAPWVEAYHARLTAGGSAAVSVSNDLRRLTVEEAAALQTFRSGWTFVGSQSARFRQIGNAVPPRLGYAVAMELGRQLAERETWERPSLAKRTPVPV